MRKTRIVALIIFTAIFYSCTTDKSKTNTTAIDVNHSPIEDNTLTEHLKPFKSDLPTIGLLIYNGVLTTEITATVDVFGKPDKAGKQLFNVITIAENKNTIISEEGLKIVPDFTFETSPILDALFVPSAYDMYAQVHNQKNLDFIKEKNKETKYTISNCAGAHLIGASGIADGKKIVTWIGGGKELQENYPNLKVQNDSIIRYMEDGKFISSNGNLVSYISALKVIEKMTSPEHREFVQSNIYINELQKWEE